MSIPYLGIFQMRYVFGVFVHFYFDVISMMQFILESHWQACCANCAK